MSHKLDYQNASKDHLKTWATLQKITLWSSIGIAIILLGLFFAFVY